jgi:[ribosomal protein S5]-alanine N-acetyltransferase
MELCDASDWGALSAARVSGLTLGGSFTVTRVLDQERIETERLLLRSWDAADASVMQRELSKVEMARMLAIPHPYPEDGAAKWIPTARPGRDFAIALRETDEVVGGITLFEQEQHRRAELGYWCAIDSWGHGYATEAVQAIIEYGFRALALNRVHAECHGDNPASRRVLEKAGMAFEGRLRKHSFRVDRFADKLLFGALRDEWMNERGS